MDFLIASHRSRPGDDPIFTLHGEAKARAAAGESIINATIGVLLDEQGELALMPSVLGALSRVPPAERAAYAPIAGRADFRQAVIDDLLGPFGQAPLGTSVATPGATGALRMAIDNFLEPGQTLLTSSFYWGPYKTLADESGRSFTTYNMFTAEGGFDVKDLDRKLEGIIVAQGRALLILNTPCHNPTGYSLEQDDWDDIVGVLERHAKRAPVTVLTDVAYAHYAPEALSACVANLGRLVDQLQVLYAWSASKSFAQYGARVGALVAVVSDEARRSQVRKAMTFSCRGLWSNCNAAGMAAITRVLTDADLAASAVAERARLVEMLASRVRCWNTLAAAASIHYPRYQGGFFTTVFTDDALGVAATLRERGVYLVPMPGALRVAMCAVSEPDIASIVQALSGVLETG